MNLKGYKNFCAVDGIGSMCKYYDSYGKAKNVDGPECEFNVDRDSGKLCPEYFNGGMCRSMKAQNNAKK